MCLVKNPSEVWNVFNVVVNTFFVCDMILQYASPHAQPQVPKPFLSPSLTPTTSTPYPLPQPRLAL